LRKKGKTSERRRVGEYVGLAIRTRAFQLEVVAGCEEMHAYLAGQSPQSPSVKGVGSLGAGYED